MSKDKGSTGKHSLSGAHPELHIAVMQTSINCPKLPYGAFYFWLYRKVKKKKKEKKMLNWQHLRYILIDAFKF